jgi:hypothetical protein
MSYQRALFYFAQLSRMIFSVHLASTRGSTSEILQHGRDLTCLIHRVCCRGDESFSPRSVPLATLNCLLFGNEGNFKRSTSYPVNESLGVGRTSIGLLAQNRVSDNVGVVKYFLGVLLRALRRARHFALS